MCTYEIGVTITPTMAIKMLASNIRTLRSMSVRNIKLFVKLMKKGDWKYPYGGCLIFNSNNILCDGRHRLQAVIDSGISQKFDICRLSNENMVSIVDF